MIYTIIGYAFVLIAIAIMIKQQLAIRKIKMEKFTAASIWEAHQHGLIEAYRLFINKELMENNRCRASYLIKEINSIDELKTIGQFILDSSLNATSRGPVLFFKSKIKEFDESHVH